MSLSAWGLYGDVWMDLASPTPPRKFRPRRPSYVLATQTTRQRADSYSHSATDLGGGSGRVGGGGVPAIAFYPHDDLDVADDQDAAAGHRRAGSLRLFSSPEPTSQRSAAGGDSRRSSRATLRSTLDANHVSAAAAGSRPLSAASSSPPGWTTLFGDRAAGSHAPSEAELNRLSLTEFTACRNVVDSAAAGVQNNDDDDDEDAAAAAIDDKLSADAAAVWRRRKNLIALSIGFLLIYTAFRSIQALQSSINAAGRLGVITMTCVHGCMAAVCPLLAPPIRSGRPPPKWTVVLAAVLYVGWMTANLWPHPLTLLPMALVAGVAQCIGWAAQVAFMRSFHRNDDDHQATTDAEDGRMSTDNHAGGEQRRARECRLNAAFVACFQTSHIWGNLVSSLMLDDGLRDGAPAAPTVIEDDGAGNFSHLYDSAAYDTGLSAIVGVYCGVYHPCGVSFASDVWNMASPGIHCSRYISVQPSLFLFLPSS